MMRSSRAVAVTLALLGAVTTLPAMAQQGPKGPSGAENALKGGGNPQAAANPAPILAARAKDQSGKSQDKASKAQDKAERAEAKGADDGKGKADEKAADEAKERGADPLGKGRGSKNGLRDIVEQLREGKLKKEQIKERLAALDSDRDDRRKAHREALRDKWGDELSNAAALQELKHHARRMALLNRMLVVLETEHTGKDKAKLIERVEKLTELENQRHERKMSQLSAKGSAAAAAGSAAAGSAPASAAPAAAAPGSSAAPAMQGAPGPQGAAGGAQ